VQILSVKHLADAFGDGQLDSEAPKEVSEDRCGRKAFHGTDSVGRLLG